MPVRVTCPTCETRFDAAATARGATVKCPNCGDFARVPKKKSRDDDAEPASSAAKWLIAGVVGVVLVCTAGLVGLVLLLGPTKPPAPAAPPVAAVAEPAKVQRADPPAGFVWLDDADFGFAVQVPKGYVAAAAKVPPDGSSVGYIAQHPKANLTVSVKAYRFKGWQDPDAAVFEKFLIGYEDLAKPAATAPVKLAGLNGFEFDFASGGTGGLADLLGGDALSGGAIPDLDDPKFLDKVEENLKKQKDSLDKAKGALKGGIGKRKAATVRVAAGPGKMVFVVRADTDGDKPDPYVWAVVTGSFAVK